MNVLKIELMKLYRRKSTKVLLVIYGLMMVALSLVYVLGEKRFGVSLFNQGQFMTASLQLVMAFILPFLTLMVTSTSFALDFSSGTIKNMFLLPVEKKDVFMGKILASQSLIGALLGIQLVYSAVFAFLIDGSFSLGVLATGFLAYMGAFVILGLVTIIAAALSLLFKSTGLILLVSYLAYVVSGVVVLYLPRLQAISMNEILGSYEAILTSGQVRLLLPILAYYILFGIGGLLLFEKKEAVVCQYE